MKNKSRVAAASLVILATAFWATGGIFITQVIRGSNLSPTNLAFWRDLSTFTVLFTSIAIFRRDLLKVMKRDLPWLIGMGIFSIGLFHVLWNTSVITNGMAIATVIQCNAPIFVTIMARLIWKEPLAPFKILAIVLSTLGTILIVNLEGFDGAKLTAVGIVVGLASAFAYGSVSLFGKKLSGDYSPWTILTYAFGIGTLTLLPFQLASPSASLMPVIGSFAKLIFITTLSGYLLYFIGLRNLPASVASILSTSEVPFAALMAYLFMQEEMTGWQMVGAMLVVVGVILVQKKPRKPKRA